MWFHCIRILFLFILVMNTILRNLIFFYLELLILGDIFNAALKNSCTSGVRMLFPKAVANGLAALSWIHKSCCKLRLKVCSGKVKGKYLPESGRQKMWLFIFSCGLFPHYKLLSPNNHSRNMPEYSLLLRKQMDYFASHILFSICFLLKQKQLTKTDKTNPQAL